jgi:hypothetical protein
VVVTVGVTLCEPAATTVPRVVIVCDVELSTIHSSVELWPLRIDSGEAENCTILGSAPAVTVTAMLHEVVWLLAPVAVTV